MVPRRARELEILPDYLAPGLRIVFCGTAAGHESARRRHYYSGAGNEFWAFLYEAGLTPVRLSAAEDGRVIEFGLGLTDLAKHVSASQDTARLREHYDVREFLEKMERVAPEWIAFHGKGAANEVSRHLGQGRHVRLGAQPWDVSDASVFVLPSASGSNRNPARLEGRATRTDWYRELAARALPPP